MRLIARKWSVSLLLMLGTMLCWAEPVDLAKARELAASYVKAGGEPALVNNGQSYNARRRAKAAAGQTATPPYYIFSRGAGMGFVVVGGDDLLPEIIGYTETGDFDPDHMPESFRDYLYGYELAIDRYQAYVEEHGEEAAAAVKAKAKARRAAARRKVVATTDLGPLMSSSWEQGWPYWDFCPWDTDNNARSLTGCVATSTSSVIHYWRKDNPRYLMTGTHPYTTWTHKLAVDPGYPAGHPMKWELMQDTYAGSNYGNNNDHYTSVSELLAIVGDLVDMDYGNDGSGAQSSMQPTALGAFNLAGTNIWYNGVNDMGAWEDMIQGDLLQGRPILYSGYAVDENNNWAGHAFVVDGYQLNEGKYHIDFGWGDYWKGFWTLSDCNGFNTDQSMTYQIYPRHLNLTATISAPSFRANTDNTVTVTVQNNGTLDYGIGINLFCSTSPNQPTAWENYQVDWTRIPKGGGDVDLTFHVNPGSGDTWYLIVVDCNMHVIGRAKVPTNENLTEVTSTYITNPSFELYDGNSRPTGWNLGTEGQFSRDGDIPHFRAVGHDGIMVLDSWLVGDKGHGISQTLRGLTKGYYRLEAKVGTDPGNTVTVFGGNREVTTGAHECGKYYLQDVVVDGIEVGSEGTLTIGVREGSWYKVDDFRLYRYLTAPETTTTEVQNPAAGQTTYDITHAMAPWLSTASLGSYANYGFGMGTWGDYSGPDGAELHAPFIEKWTPAGNYLDNASMQQTIRELVNGTYYIGGSFVATSQGVANDHVEGVTFWAGDQSVSLGTGNGVPETYSLRVEVTDGTLTFGLKTDCTTANWVAMDNLFLLWAGEEANYYAQATETTPVRVPLTNPRMENNLDGWTLNDYWQKQGATYANFDPDFMECWTGHGSNLSNRSALQYVNLNAGIYRAAAAVNAVQQGDGSISVSGVTLRFGNQSVACHTGDGVPEIFTTGKFTTDGGNTALGLYIENTNANWVAWDNVVVYCYGADVEEAYWRALRSCKKSQADNEQSVKGAATAALAQYEWTEAEYATKTREEINAAIEVLTNGTLIASSSQVATSLVRNSDFRGDIKTLAVQGDGGRVEYPAEWTFLRTYAGWNDTWVDTANGLFNAWAGSMSHAELYQALSSLPNGTYRLTGDVRVDNPAASSKTTLYGKGGETVHSEAAGSDIAGSTNDFATYSVMFPVTDNTATIGILSNYSFYQLKNLILEFVTESAVATGDINRDGNISIADVTALVNIILGKDNDGSQYDHAAADVNKDGSVTIADVTALVNQILGK
ncbi:MAG: C10 family peptidase [Bacteroidaceae bacterium]|nr:C10 family peptidase [Bacteroidaceae bacterium]